MFEDQPDNLSAKLNKDHKDEKAMHLELHEPEALIIPMNKPDE